MNLVVHEATTRGNNYKSYNITNEEIFDKVSNRNQNELYNYNMILTEDEKADFTYKIMDNVIVEPFIKTLKMLVFQGANPHA